LYSGLSEKVNHRLSFANYPKFLDLTMSLVLAIIVTGNISRWQMRITINLMDHIPNKMENDLARIRHLLLLFIQHYAFRIYQKAMQ
jgi:hypothetical protein